MADGPTNRLSTMNLPNPPGVRCRLDIDAGPAIAGSTAARSWAMTAATQASIRRLGSLCSLASRAARESSWMTATVRVRRARDLLEEQLRRNGYETAG
jgi:hypothetical protein